MNTANLTVEPLVVTGSETRLDPIIRNNPFPFYKALREQKPVYYDPGLDVYLVTRYEDAVSVLRDDVTYSLEHGYQDRYANGFIDEFAAILERDGGGFIRDLAIDPPAHTRLRKLTEKAFTAHRVKDLEQRIREIVVDLVEQVAAKGHADGMTDIAGPLTAHIICEQLGLDWDEVGYDKVNDWTRAVIDQIGRMQTKEAMLENARVMCDLQNYIIGAIRDRQENPREDMISDLVHARVEGEEQAMLTFTEQVSTVRGFLVAGNDTTAAAIANLLYLLATQEGLADELYRQVDDERKMVRFVEELLRLQPPVHGLFRTAMKDVDLGGTHVPAGSQLCVMYASANRDEAKFPAPDRLDQNRPNLGASVAFGAGIHRCVGIALARMEIKVAAQEIVRRLADIRLAVAPEEITYLPTVATHTIERLPLMFCHR